MSKASFANLTTDLDVIQKLDDLPNAVGGLSAADLKAKFDEAANAVKDYINTVLLAQLQAETPGQAGANRIGISGIVGLTGTNNVQDALAAIYAAAQAAQAGTILDKSITAEKLADGAVENSIIKDGAVTNAKLGTGSVSNSKCNFAAGLTIAGKLTLQDKVILDPDCYGTTLPSTAEAGRLFFLKVQ